MLLINRILNGSALQHLKELSDESIDCVVTSPPYWALRDYGNSTEIIWEDNKNCEHEWLLEITKRPNSSGGQGEKSIIQKGNIGSNFSDYSKRQTESNFCLKCGAWKGQLGLESTFDLYIKHLCGIFDEVKRIQKKDGTCWVNLGDSYFGGGHGGASYKEVKGVMLKDPKFGIGRNNCPEKNWDYSKYQAKCLCMIPERFALEMINRGWILRNKIIWYKPNCMPSSVKDRFTVDFEYVFFFVKNKNYWFETQYEELRTPYEQLLKDKRGLDNENYKNYTISNRHGGNKTIGETINPQGRNKRCVWTISTQPFKEAHFAVFPEALVEPMIKAGCPEFVCNKCGKAREKIIESNWRETKLDFKGITKHSEHKESSERRRDTNLYGRLGDSKKELIGYTDCNCNARFSGGMVLDPFFGAGTTGLVALKLNRNFIGIELNPEYIKIAKNRLKPYLEQTKLKIRGGD